MVTDGTHDQLLDNTIKLIGYNTISSFTGRSAVYRHCIQSGREA